MGNWRAGKLPFESAPEDEDGLLDLHLALYNNIIVFDHATKLAYCVTWVHMGAHAGVPEAYLAGKRALAAMTERISPLRTPNLPLGKACPISAPPERINLHRITCVPTLLTHASI